MNMTTHKVTIKTKKNGEFLSGYNCEIYIDDKSIHGVKGFKFALEAGDSGPVFKLEFYPGEINIEGLTGDTVAVGDFMKDLLSM